MRTLSLDPALDPPTSANQQRLIRSTMGGGQSREALLERHGQLLSRCEREAVNKCFVAITGRSEAESFSREQLLVSTRECVQTADYFYCHVVVIHSLGVRARNSPSSLRQIFPGI